MYTHHQFVHVMSGKERRGLKASMCLWQAKRARGQGPSAIVRQYDNLLVNVKDLTETASQLGGAAGEYLLDECNAKASCSIQ